MGTTEVILTPQAEKSPLPFQQTEAPNHTEEFVMERLLPLPRESSPGFSLLSPQAFTDCP